ncbi:hypothetical protein BaRGS_00007457 [Batillaria attramentaria]|uniref:Uncharacterized protein n=1 Tax=Batillaria attramentaria TaxID=370345 RepID=A0ABD0LP19_9CAEN
MCDQVCCVFSLSHCAGDHYITFLVCFQVGRSHVGASGFTLTGPMPIQAPRTKEPGCDRCTHTAAFDIHTA